MKGARTHGGVGSTIIHMPNPTATTANPALLPSPALFDVTTIAAKDVEGTIERVALDQLELAANARRDISEEGIERLYRWDYVGDSRHYSGEEGFDD